MATDLDIFAEATRLTEAGMPFVLVTVIATKGSSPRDAGAKMIWRPEGGLRGTVGGGQFEMLVMESAARVFAARSCATEHFVLGAEAEQCCGGTMDVFLEYCGARRRLVVFGAGHVAKELADVLRGSPLEMVVVDDREEWNSAERFSPPLARRVMDWDEGVRVARERGSETLACVMTCSHETDLRLLGGLLQSGGGSTDCSEQQSVARGDVPAFVGLIGSRSKRACLFGRLVASGVDEELVGRVQCPIGVGDTGKPPRMVAISMAAGLLLEAKRMEEGGRGVVVVRRNGSARSGCAGRGGSVVDHVIVLAAGRGVRAGGPKALHMVRGERWWRVQERRLERAGLPVVWVVSERVRRVMEEEDGGPGRVVVADEMGPMFVSVVAGVREVEEWRGGGAEGREGGGVFVLPVDVPAPPPGSEVFARLVRAVGNGREEVAAIPTYRGERGHPVYVAWAFARERVLGAEGTADARLDRLIGERRALVDVEDAGVVVNLNTAEEFEGWGRREGEWRSGGVEGWR